MASSTLEEFDIIQRQKNSLSSLLTLNESRKAEQQQSSNHSVVSPWKILIYDNRGETILAPLVKVAELRQMGVSVYVNISEKRTPVPEVSALYLIEPNTENIEKICDDLKNRLYRKFFVEFISPIPEDLLQHFAKRVLSTGAGHAGLISRISDSYFDFVSCMNRDFSLCLPKTFTILNSSSDSQISATLNRIVAGFLSVIVTLECLPIIVCPSNPTSPARLIATQLCAALKTYWDSTVTHEVGGPYGAAPAFGSSLPSSSKANSKIRSIVYIEDRSADFFVMLAHPWTYRALIHDMFGIHLNKVKVPKTTKTATMSPTYQEYELDPSDKLWSSLYACPFSDVADAIPEALAEFNAEMTNIRSAQNVVGDDKAMMTLSTASISDAVDKIPELTARKRAIDLHTAVATAVITCLKERQLDKYFELESTLSDSFTSSIQSSSATVASVQSIVSSKEIGTLKDKIRLLLCLYLGKGGADLASKIATMAECIDALEPNNSAKSAANSFRFIKHFETLNSSRPPSAVPQQSQKKPQLPPSFSTGSVASQAVMWGSRVIDKSRGFLLQGVKQFIPPREEWQVLKLCSQLLEAKQPSGLPRGYTALDPWGDSQSNTSAGDPSLLDMSFFSNVFPTSRACVFLVGGGSYVESAVLHRWAEKNNKEIIYGCTDFVSGENFLEELAELGAQVKQ